MPFEIFYTFGDLDCLVADLPRALVHFYFLVSIITYIGGTLFVVNGFRSPLRTKQRNPEV